MFDVVQVTMITPMQNHVQWVPLNLHSGDVYWDPNLPNDMEHRKFLVFKDIELEDLQMTADCSTLEGRGQVSLADASALQPALFR